MEIEKYPYAVSINHLRNWERKWTEFGCSGAIISQWHILTEKDCFQDINLTNTTDPMHVSQFYVAVGQNTTVTTSGRYGIEEVYLHPFPGNLAIIKVHILQET